jgi:hypothetical protein
MPVASQPLEQLADQVVVFMDDKALLLQVFRYIPYHCPLDSLRGAPM